MSLAKVKNVLSGDTLLLSSPNKPDFIFGLSCVRAPAIGANEPYSFQSKEALRRLALGKLIRYHVAYTTHSGREFGDFSIDQDKISSIVETLISKGSVKVKENEREEYNDLQARARTESLGLWGKVALLEIVSEPSDKDIGKSFKGIVEKVLSTDRILVRLFLAKNLHGVFPLTLAGLKKADDEMENESAKKLVEAQLGGKDVHVTLLSERVGTVLLSASGADVSEKALENGLVQVADWQSSLLGSAKMGRFRELARKAQNERKGIWRTHSQTSNENKKDAKKLTGSVYRVVSGDTLQITVNDELVTVQLSSLRSPRQSDNQTLSSVSKEFVRKTCIGKNVGLKIDSVRPKSDSFPERPLVRVTLPNGKDLSQVIVENGMAGVVKHKSTDSDRSPDWDVLVELEKSAQTSQRGIFSSKVDPERIVEASETAARAKPFLNTLQGKSRIPAIVEHVVSSSRFRILLPRESTKMTFLLAGLSNSRDLSPEIAAQAMEFVNRKVLQRDVQIEVSSIDKNGAFIGDLYISNQLLQIPLLEMGFAKVHGAVSNQLLSCEKQAHSLKKGLWALEEEKIEEKVEKLSLNVFKAVVTDFSEDGVVSFHKVDSTLSEFKKMQESLRVYLGENACNLEQLPKVGDFVAAKFSENEKYYRARIVDFDKATREYKIRQIDYGTIDYVSQSSLKKLPSNFGLAKFPAKAISGEMGLISLPPVAPTNYLDPALDYLFENALDREFVVRENFSGNVTLMDPGKSASFTLSRDLVSRGLAIVKKQLTPVELLMKNEWEILLKLESKAKEQHLGCWVFGDIEDDED